MSTAVMASSKKLGPDSLNFFPTPPWAVRALIEEVLRPHSFFDLSKLQAADTSCGAGHLATPLREVFGDVFASDIHDWGYGDRRNLDFLEATADDLPADIDWFILNPPFPLAHLMLQKAWPLARSGVAMLLRVQWLEGIARYNSIFGTTGLRPNLICPFADRVPMIEGVWDPEAKSATAYAWFVWFKGKGRQSQTIVEHIRPGAPTRYYRPSDELLATRGEAKRRRLQRAEQADLFEAA